MDRRAFLRTASTAAAATTILSGNEATARNAKPGELNATPKAVFSLANKNRLGIQSTLDPWVPGTGEWNMTTIGHLYRRAGFGARLSEITAASAKTPGAVVDSLLDDTLLSAPNLPNPPSYSDAWLNKAPYLGGDQATQIQQQTLYAEAMLNIRGHWAMLMNEPKTMLRERMVLFWMNHFVVEEQKVYYPQLMYRYLDYFRRNAWGNFKQMVKDVTISPAMLIYLDGWYNKGTSPNENYAREVQELFTMGVYDKNGNANYTQADVEGLAHALTGWTVDTTAAAPNVLPAVYQAQYHDSSFQQIYDGVKQQYNLAASGVSGQVDLIDHMFEQRGAQIAWFIASKLYQYFVYHQITTQAELDIVQQLADTLQASWSIKDLLDQLLKSQHFFDSANIGAGIKSPIDHIIPLIRQFDIQQTELTSEYLYAYTYTQGQYLLDPPNVKGWVGYHAWISTTTLPLRNAIATQLVTGKSLPAGGTDGNGNNLQPVNLDSPTFQAWAKQLQNYNVDFDSVLNEVATFFCAQTPGPMAIAYVKSQLPSNTYEWSTLDDNAKESALRQMITGIMLLAEYQLY